MFRKTKAEPEPTPEATPESKPQGKGRPTPTRKEAQAAAKARARGAKDPKAAKRVLRERQAERNRKVREGMKRGDEKYLMARDQGPVRRYIRDWVDSRLTFTEFILPALILGLVLQYSGGSDPKAWQSQVGNAISSFSFIIVLLDVAWMSFRLRRDLRKKFPGESTRGAFLYALLRSLQLRFMRLPKPKVGIGGKPINR